MVREGRGEAAEGGWHHVAGLHCWLFGMLGWLINVEASRADGERYV